MKVEELLEQISKMPKRFQVIVRDDDGDTQKIAKLSIDNLNCKVFIELDDNMVGSCRYADSCIHYESK